MAMRKGIQFVDGSIDSRVALTEVLNDAGAVLVSLTSSGGRMGIDLDVVVEGH